MPYENISSTTVKVKPIDYDSLRHLNNVKYANYIFNVR
ncbi:hypothetical protein [Chryseobacterium aquaticum]